MAFTHKTIRPEDSFGADVREARERAGYSRTAAARATNLPISLLRNWEEERWDRLGDPRADLRLFRSYIHFLGAREVYFLEKYQTCMKLHVVHSEGSAIPRPIRMRVFDVFVGSRWLHVAGLVLFATGLASYVGAQVVNVSQPPPLFITEPADGARLRQPSVHVQGSTTPDAAVKVNGASAIVQPDGTFSLDLPVPRGTTTLSISSQRRHSREMDVTRHVVYDRALPSSLTVQE